MKKLTAKQRVWVFGYLQKRLPSSLWNPNYPYDQAPDDPDARHLTHLVATLQNDPDRGTEKFRTLDNALRKKIWRGRGDGVERTVILDKDLDKDLTGLMRAENWDRSTAVNRCIENAASCRKQEWDKLEAKRLSLQKREKRLKALLNKMKERNEANRNARMAEAERRRAENALDLLVRGLSKAPDDAAVEFQFGEDGLISDIEFRERSSRTRVWSESARRELRKALERHMSGETCSTQEDDALGQSQR